jgi:Sec-independent protein translocase protein TatA
MSDGWYIGWGVGLLFVVIVVVLLLLMIRGASRAGDKAVSIVEAFNGARDNTAGLWNVDTTNRTIVNITESARAAREHLEATAGPS